MTKENPNKTPKEQAEEDMESHRINDEAQQNEDHDTENHGIRTILEKMRNREK